MAETWTQSKQWADQFIPHIKTLLGEECIQVATPDQEQRQNTDLIFDVQQARYAIRVRRAEARLAFNRRNEVTLRASRGSGMTTELAKLMEGLGDCFFYGWGDSQTHRVLAYSIIDLNVLRRWLFETALTQGKLPGQLQYNADHSSAFQTLCLDCLPIRAMKERRTQLPGDPPIQDKHWQSAHAGHLLVQPSLWERS